MATTKKSSNAQVEQTTKTITGMGAGEYPTIYTNFMGIGATPFDISIVFGEVDQRGSNVEAVPKTKVIMAPEQAANLVMMLSQAIKQFVEQNGKLRISGKVNMPNEG